jgi:hypothetical protein
MERLQEQLLEALARARVQEARAAESEKCALQAEEQLEALARSQLDESMRLREQVVNLREQIKNAEARARSLEIERAQRESRLDLNVVNPQHGRNMLHLAAGELNPRPAKGGRANLVLSGLLASALSFGGAAYFMFYAPIQKQAALLEQQRTQDAQEHARALTNLRAQSDAERRGIEAQVSDLRAQLDKARSELAAAQPQEDTRRGRAARLRSAEPDDTVDAASVARSARAERRMRRRAAQQDEDTAEAPPPAAAKPHAAASSGDTGDDPLGGL